MGWDGALGWFGLSLYYCYPLLPCGLPTLHGAGASLGGLSSNRKPVIHTACAVVVTCGDGVWCWFWCCCLSIVWRSASDSMCTILLRLGLLSLDLC
ncbi:hypothetical protein F5144DRAFT_382388 [Chaetomium tenue]|uniref:Uncharacterized protein n=1 Tax=Chaetomium tenue TaxID=1854479 RepID=A0ACB7NV17_9PEZI|nr:hypothetical protein F5144DRAFT_382388 [Chaetomium globosum]